jgi:hypothetical protein
MLLFILSFILFYIYGSIYLPYQEQRTDLVKLSDPILNLLPNYDMSVFIEITTRSIVIITVIDIIYYQENIYEVEKLLFKYAIALTIKMLTLYAMPVDIPDGYISLSDSWNIYYTGKSETYARDLFFSGHTVLTYLCFSNCTSNIIYTTTGCFTILLGIALMVNRVHYAIDIVMAPFIGSVCNQVVNLLL